MSHTESGSLVGGGFGAATGAMIGHATGNTAAGALIGGATGALAGGLIGNAEDARDERDAALARARHAQLASRALTNADVVSMSQNGVGDEVIIGAIRSSGGRFDLGPNALIQMKQMGVSDNVISYIQLNRYPAGDIAYAPPPPEVYVVPPPRPTVWVGVGASPRPYHWHRHHRRW